MEGYNEFSICYDNQAEMTHVALKYNQAILELYMSSKEWEPLYKRITAVISGVQPCQYIEITKDGETFSLQFIYSSSLEAVLMRLESPDFLFFNGNAYLSSLSTEAGITVYACPSWQT